MVLETNANKRASKQKAGAILYWTWWVQVSMLFYILFAYTLWLCLSINIFGVMLSLMSKSLRWAMVISWSRSLDTYHTWSDQAKWKTSFNPNWCFTIWTDRLYLWAKGKNRKKIGHVMDNYIIFNLYTAFFDKLRIFRNFVIFWPKFPKNDKILN